jgi:hypothetical protein
VKQCPKTPALADVEFSGHVWVQELPTGGTFRFQVAASGLVTFATARRSFDTPASVPPQFRRAAELINEQLDREALEAATNDPSDVTFCGIATRNEGLEYDWNALPAFVGVDIWSNHKDQFLSPDAAAGVFNQLGVPTLPAIAKELAAVHADFTQYEGQDGFPKSEWREGHAAGVLIRDKSGRCAAEWCLEQNTVTAPEPQAAVELATEYTTDERVEQTIDTLRADGHPVTVDTVRDRLVADVAREAYVDLFADGEFVASLSAFQSAVAKRVQQYQFETQ